MRLRKVNDSPGVTQQASVSLEWNPAVLLQRRTQVPQGASPRAGPGRGSDRDCTRTEDVLQASVRGGTPTLRGSSVVRRKAIWGETSGNSASKHPVRRKRTRRELWGAWAPCFPKLHLPPELLREWAEPILLDCSSHCRQAGEPEPAKSCHRKYRNFLL